MMSQQVQELINKIKTEGVQAADQKVKEIETNAQNLAAQVVADAESRARQIVVEAKAQAEKIHESTRAALKQAARDTILALRKDIEKNLHNVIAQQIKESLSTEYLAGIIEDVIKKSIETNGAEAIEVILNAEDLDKLKNGFLANLQAKVKQPITLSSDADITSGFTISFDAGKSCFDFTDASLTEYLSSYLNNQVSALVKESVN